MNKLTAIKRSKTDKLGDIRSNGMVPAVVYGAQVENTPISVSSVNFQKVFRVAGETSTIVLELEDDSEGKSTPDEAEKSKTKKKFDVLIHEVQVHPVKGFPIHVDFLAIDMNKPIEVAVPIEFIGIAPAEKNGLGVLVKVLYELEIQALPKDIPHVIEVDLSILETLDSQIQAKDISLPSSVKILTDENEVIALVSVIKEEIEEEAPVDLSAIDVEKKGKKEEDTPEVEENKA